MTTPTGPGPYDPVVGTTGTGFPAGASRTTTGGGPSSGGPSSGGPSSDGSSAVSSDSGRTEQAKQAAGAAKEEGKHVASTAKEEAANVAGEAKQQARNLSAELRSEVTQQSRTQLDRLAGLLREVGDELQEMASKSEHSGVASQLAGQLADRTKQISQVVEGREPGDLLDEVKRYAARKPGIFLLGAVAAGALAGRLSRGVAASHGVESLSDVKDRVGGGGQPSGGEQPVAGSVDVTPASEGGLATGAGSAVPGSYGGPAPTGPTVDPVEPGYPTTTPTTPTPMRPRGNTP